MQLDLIVQAVGVFAVTNIDDLVVLSLFFGRSAGVPGGVRRVVTGQYVGFAGILAVAVVGGLGASRLPEQWIAYLGLVPLLLGIREGARLLRPAVGGRADADLDSDVGSDVDGDRGLGRGGGRGDDTTAPAGPGVVMVVASVTFANGGDNLALYVPVFAASGPGSLWLFVTVFAVMIGLWCAAGLWIATRPPIARALERWGDIALPVVLIVLGLTILWQGGALHR